LSNNSIAKNANPISQSNHIFVKSNAEVLKWGNATPWCIVLITARALQAYIHFHYQDPMNALSCLFSGRHFGHFCWNILVICLTIVLKLAVTVFLVCISRHSDRNDLIFFSHFKIVSVYDRKKTGLNPINESEDESTRT